MFDDEQSDDLNSNEQNIASDSDITEDNITSEYEEETPGITEDTSDANINDASSDSEVTDITDTPVTVQPVQFASFDEEENIYGKENKNLDLLMNVNLQMSVELGRTELPFKKVLELTRGSIISLDKLAGEPVELFANGKLVAFGEVVVIEDNFGLRITSIAAPEERLRTVHESKSTEEKKM